jgi:Ca2+-binding EF-hand superfamily protein
MSWSSCSCLNLSDYPNLRAYETLTIKTKFLLCANASVLMKRELKDRFFLKKKDGQEKTDFDDFLQILDKQWKSFDAKDELRNAFSALDKNGNRLSLYKELIGHRLNVVCLGNGYVTQDEFKDCMLTLGEKLTDEEMHDIIKDCNVNTDGTINYEGWLTLFF